MAPEATYEALGLYQNHNQLYCAEVSLWKCGPHDKWALQYIENIIKILSIFFSVIYS